MRLFSRRCARWCVFLICMATSVARSGAAKPEIVQTKRIWDAAPHNAFTDLVYWNESFYCAFREGEKHVGDLGQLRIIVSADGEQWRSAALLSMDKYDLRDAALSITPDNRLMVLGGAQQMYNGKRLTGTCVAFSSDGLSFTSPQLVIPLGQWLWRVTWHGNTAYGVSYSTANRHPISALLKTTDGVQYETVTDQLLDVGGWPTEARIRFAGDGTAYCLHRRDGEQNTAYFGMASAPYTDWSWRDLGTRLGGPNFLQIPDGEWIGAARRYEGGTRTEVFRMDIDKGVMTPLLRLPSGGDTSYPGMVWKDDTLWVSYYSSHEGKTSIDLTKIRFDGVNGGISETAYQTETAYQRAYQTEGISDRGHIRQRAYQTP